MINNNNNNNNNNDNNNNNNNNNDIIFIDLYCANINPGKEIFICALH